MQFREIMVSSRSGPYPIRVGTGIRKKFSEWLVEMGFPFTRKVALLSNRTVRPLHADAISASLDTRGFPVENFDFPDGESYKTLDSVRDCLDWLLGIKWERQNPILAVGGGVVGDMGGFIASILLRGVPLVHIPTTVVGQVDSSIGGKTGVDHHAGKNLIGSFYPPRSVWIDPFFLETLPLRERRSGLGEVIKYALIGNPKLLGFLDDNLEALSGESFDRTAWEETIFLCASDKARIVSEDERESGLRMNLNFGHTFGHALEGAMGYQGILHGEAVGLGMIAAARVSRSLGMTGEETEETIRTYLKRAHLPDQWPEGIRFSDLEPFLKSDKKTSSGLVTLVLPVRPGEVVRTRDYEPSVLGLAIA